MTLQLNPNTTDAYESKTLAQMRQYVFDGLGFLSPISTVSAYQDTLANMRNAIIQRLGLALALLGNTDTYANIAADVYAAGGFAAMGTHPPGVDTLISTIINDVHRTLFARIEFDKGGVTPPTVLSGTNPTLIDATPVRLLAIAELKAHYGKPDAQAYGQQAEKYLTDLTQRTPPNIVGQINAALIEAHNTVTRRYEMAGLLAPSNGRGGSSQYDLFGQAIDASHNYTSTASDGDLTQVDYHPVILLATANLKAKIGQPDAKALQEQYEQYLADQFHRLPPNATSIVNNQLKFTQQMLYRKYEVFRMERWWTWSLVAGQRFYGTFGDDNANSLAPTNGLAVIGDAVTSHEMTTPRNNEIVIGLRDGTVLVVGGAANFGQLASAEIFDPKTGQFSATGSMATPRQDAAACLLADGRVLVAGGTFGTRMKSIEIYDPTARTFSTSAAVMSVGRALLTATLLANGNVLLVGGRLDSGSSTTVVELYDPVADTISATGSLSTARRNHTATLLPSSDVLIAGGGAASAEVYDHVGATFSETGAMTASRSNAAAALLADGSVLVAGGFFNTAEIYFQSSNSWAATSGNMAISRASAASSLLENEKVLIAGGDTGGSLTADVYDPLTRTFSATGLMPYGFISTQAALLQDGRVLIPGGTLSSVSIQTALLYDTNANTFSLTGNLTQGTVYYQITAETANGQSLPGTEFFVSAVPANHAVNLSWVPVPNQPFVLYFDIYGRVTGGTKQFIARVSRSQTTYTDEGTIPPDGALPTINATAGPGALDPRNVTWVGLSFNDNVWNPLIKGIPPMAFGQNINGVPTNYEIRQALEIWPAPTSTDWKVQVKGYFQPMVFESDNDFTTLDWQAIYLQTVADCMPRFKTHGGQPWFTQLEIAQAAANSQQYIKRLVAGSHMTARYVPGVILERNAVRPVLVGPYQGYP